MKKFIILFLLTSLFYNCKVKEKPEFINVKNISVIEATSTEVSLTADAIFNNPNHIGGTLETDGIEVYVNGIKTVTVSSEAFKVPARDTFSVPLLVKIPTSKIINSNSIGGLLNSILSKKVNVQYKGVLKYKVLGFSHTYNIDETKDVKIKF
jgi:hypothetical protein